MRNVKSLPWKLRRARVRGSRSMPTEDGRKRVGLTEYKNQYTVFGAHALDKISSAATLSLKLLLQQESPVNYNLR